MERIWLKHYPEGIPADITDQAAACASLADMMEQSAKKHAERVAYVSMGAQLRYRELDASSRQFAAWLQSVGVQKGDRVALMMPNLLQYPVCLFGALRAGAVVVNTNPLYTATELLHQLRDSGAQTIVIAENFAHILQQVVAQTQVRNIVVTSVGEMLGGVKGWITNLVVRKVKKMVPAWSLPGAISLQQALAHGRNDTYRKVPLTHADLAFLQYTGGTTGVAKGAMLTHGNMVSNVFQAYAWLRPNLKDEEVIITALPLYHIFALTANCLVFLHIGAQNVLILNPRDIPNFVKTLRGTRFSTITGVNTLFNGLLNNPDFSRLDFSALHIALGGGMAVQEAVAQRWFQTTGVPLIQAYGLTETSPAATINPIGITTFSPSIGLPVPSTDVSIRDNDGKAVPQGESGEICIKGPQVTPGYWQRPEETRKVFTEDGFLMTGDIGTMDEKGYVYILDRKKDLILVSGFNVYPNEVEDAAMQHPDVLEVAAIGVPDERTGEAVKLFVIRKNDKLTEEALLAHCRTLLTGYKRPRSVEFRDDLPRSNVGKILRRELRDAVSSA